MIGRSMATLGLAGALSIACALSLAPANALACGYEGNEGACDTGGTATAQDAHWLLGRAVDAVIRDEATAIDAFSRGAAGFRTQDLYVFCINAADGRIVASRSSAARAGRSRAARSGRQSVRSRHAERGNGRRGDGSQLPVSAPGATIPVPKTSFVTRVKDLVCGVGYNG